MKHSSVCLPSNEGAGRDHSVLKSSAGSLTLTAGPAGVFVHGLLYLDHDKVVCQAQEKTNRPDSGSIYILLCNT